MRQRRRLFVSIANKLIFGRLGIAGLAFLRLRVAQVGWHWQLRRNWPGLPLLRAKMELDLPFTLEPERIVEFFAEEPPQTSNGALMLAIAQKAMDDQTAAEVTAIDAWLTMPMPAASEAGFLEIFGEILRPFDAAPYVVTNINDDHQTEGREDYTIKAGDNFRIGQSGISPDSMQYFAVRKPLRSRGTRLQVEVVNSEGTIKVHSSGVNATIDDEKTTGSL